MTYQAGFENQTKKTKVWMITTNRSKETLTGRNNGEKERRHIQREKEEREMESDDCCFVSDLQTRGLSVGGFVLTSESLLSQALDIHNVRRSTSEETMRVMADYDLLSSLPFFFPF